MNAVIVQIKPTADAFYPSNYGPWSEYITVHKEKDPGYDPLAFMIEEAHKRNIEFHAWINPYRITMNHTDINRLSNNHPARQHRIGLYLMAENYITTRYSRSKKVYN
ncbi:family 10 glycosylhydrolase [Bacillus paranthracis]